MPRLIADIGPLRRHRPFRRLWLGQLLSGTGSQLTVVAVAYQTFRTSHSSLVVGLVSSAQLIPLLAGSQIGGALADALDRRRVLVVTEALSAAASAGLVVNAMQPRSQLWPLFVCTAAGAATQAADQATRRAAIPALVPTQDLTAAVALQTVLITSALVAGPAIGGVLIGLIGLPAIYSLDVATFGVALAASLALPALVPEGGGTPAGLRSMAEGLAFLHRNRLLAASYVIDVNAMVFGMPRAVFPALGTGLFHGGASAVGLLYAAPGAGALGGSLLTGWVRRVRRQGRAVVIAVVCWGLAIAWVGLVHVLWEALVLLVVAGAADAVSAVFRSSIQQVTTPGHLQGRLSGTYFAVVAGGPRLGDIETGVVSSVATPRVAVWSGGLACLLGAAAVVWRFPELWRSVMPGTDDPDDPDDPELP